VLALAPDLAPLDNGERFALDLLLDLSRVLRVDGDVATVTLQVVESEAAADAVDLPTIRSRAWGLGVSDGEVVVERALLSVVLRVAGAVSEQRTSAADRYGRVPAGETDIVRAGLEREPVISEAARAVAAAVRRAAGETPAFFLAPWPDGKRWAAALTHDLDVVEWWPAFTSLRLAELARKGEIARIARVLGAVAVTAGRDVVWRGVRDLIATERAHGVRSSWFVLTGDPTLATAAAGDLTYRPDSAPTRRILAAIRDAGHEIGLHGSFATSDDHALFTVQRARLSALSGSDVVGVRQHYLRMRAGATPRGMHAARFGYDSTAGFADRNGFRLGVADVLPIWDDAHDTVLPLLEVPFIWMDRALSKYRGVEDPNAWIDDALALAERCRAVEGLFVGIWHPNLTPALGFPGAPAAYSRLVRALVERDAWIVTLGEIVDWRRRRAAVRGTTVAPDGVPRLAASELTPRGMRVALETADGRTVETRVGD
jgi:peptidoglycan/xylan/chitin deacetylase (PgdA/CDA1 family)